MNLQFNQTYKAFIEINISSKATVLNQAASMLYYKNKKEIKKTQDVEAAAIPTTPLLGQDLHRLLSPSTEFKD